MSVTNVYKTVNLSLTEAQAVEFALIDRRTHLRNAIGAAESAAEAAMFRNRTHDVEMALSKVRGW